MKSHIAKHFATCVLLAGAAFAVQAQPAPNGPPAGQPNVQHAQPGKHQFDPAKHAERVNKRLADLKQKLKITSSQETAWTSFSNALQPTARPQRPDRDAFARMTTPDRIDHMRALRTQRNAEMDRKADATKAFYAQLSAEQKTTFDGESAKMFHRGHRRG